MSGRYRGYEYYGRWSGCNARYGMWFWLMLAELVILAAETLYDAQRKRKTARKLRDQRVERARRPSEVQPKSLNPAPEAAEVSAQWRRARGGVQAASRRQTDVKVVAVQLDRADVEICGSRTVAGQQDQAARTTGPNTGMPDRARGARRESFAGRKLRGNVAEVLRFGSMLLDLEPTVDNSLVMRLDRNGTRKVIVARNPGLKGWLRKHCPEIGYSTAMRYKQMAAQARKACGLPKDVPLEWVFEGEEPRDTERSARTPANLTAARGTLARMVTGSATKRQFFGTLDETLGTRHYRMARPRKRPCPAAQRRMDERKIDSLLVTVRLRAQNPEGIHARELRERLLQGLQQIAEDLSKASA